MLALLGGRNERRARAVCANVDTGGDLSTIDLLELVDGRKCLGKLYSVRKEVWGDDDVEDVGEGGPSAEGNKRGGCIR